MDLLNNPSTETVPDRNINEGNIVDGPVETDCQLRKDRESKCGRDHETNHTSGGDESEEYESANEGDTDGEAAAVDEAAAASVALTVMTVPLVNNSPVEPSFATPPTVTSSQQSSPDREEGATVEPIEQNLSTLNIADGSTTLTKQQQSQADGECILASTEISDDHPPEEVESKEAEESSTDNENMSHRLAGVVSTPLDVRDNILLSWGQTNSNGSLSVSASVIKTAELSRATGGAVSSREESSRNGDDSAQPRSSIDEGDAGNGKDENWETEESGENEEGSANCEDDEEEEVDEECGDDDEEAAQNNEETCEVGEGSEDVVSADKNGNSLPGEPKYFKEGDKQHPAYIPKEGKFFMHDVRTNERDQGNNTHLKVDSPKGKVFPREWQPQTDSRRWQHDMYPHPQNTVPCGKGGQQPKCAPTAAEFTSPKSSNLPLSNSGNRRRGSGLARSGRAKANVNESYSANYNDSKFTPDSTKKRNARNAGSAAGRAFNRASKNLSTTEDEIAASEALIERQGPPWQRKIVTSGNFVHSGGAGTYPGAGGASRKQQHSDMSAVAVYRNANRSYKESDDSGYNVDDFEASGTSFNHSRFNGNNIYHVQQRIDDGSRHGAFLSARRQVYRPQTAEKVASESKQKREGYKKMGVSYEDRMFASGKGKQEATSNRSFDLPLDVDGSQRVFSKKKAHSRERETKSTIDRYSSTLERSKSSRNEPDASRRGGKSRIEVSQRNKSGSVGVFEAHRKGSSEKKTSEVVERTDSSDVDHDHRNDRKKGDQFETPPRFERLSNSSTNGLNTDGMLSSKKIGVTRPFVLNCNRQDVNLDSDHQIGYIASEEQDVSDSAANSNSIGHHQNSNKSSYMNNNRGNRRYSASRRVTSPQNNDSSSATPSSSTAGVTATSHTSLSLFGNQKLKSNVNTIRENSISQPGVEGFLTGLANNAINSNTSFPPMTHHQQQMASRGGGGHHHMNDSCSQSLGGTVGVSSAAYYSNPAAAVATRSAMVNSSSHHQQPHHQNPHHHHQTSLQQRNLLAANAQVGPASAPPGVDHSTAAAALHNYGPPAVPQMGNNGFSAGAHQAATMSHQLAAVAGTNPHLTAASFSGGFSQNGVSAATAAAYANYFSSNLHNAMSADATAASLAHHQNSVSAAAAATNPGGPHQYNPSMHAAMYYYPAMAAAAAAQQYISGGMAPPSAAAAAAQMYPNSAAAASALLGAGGSETLTNAAVAAAAAVGALTESQQMDLMAAAAMASVPYQQAPPPPPQAPHQSNPQGAGPPQGGNPGAAVAQMHQASSLPPSLLMQQQPNHHPGGL